MKRIKVVLDTNILISSLLRKNSIPHRIFEAAEQQVILLFTSPDILAEVEAVLSRPKLIKRTRMSQDERVKFIKTLRAISVIVDSSIEIPQLESDHDDTKFLACAIEGQAEYIVSGDSHLLDLKSYKNIPILSPADFIKQVLEK